MTRVALFVAGLAGIFLASLAVGNVVDVEARTVAAEAGHGDAMSAPAGLALEQDGYRLVQARSSLVAGRSRPYVFRIVAPDGSVLRDYDVEHERRLHLIVVGREPDAPFLHLHPRQRADGSLVGAARAPVSGLVSRLRGLHDRRRAADARVDLAGAGRAAARSACWDSIYAVKLREQGDRLAFDVRGDRRPA